MTKITADELQKLRAKLARGSHGGKQMAKLSSRESRWVDRLIDYAFQDYPQWIESQLGRNPPPDSDGKAGDQGE